MSRKITLPDGQVLHLSPKQSRILQKDPRDMTSREKVIFLRLFLTVKGKLSN